MAQVTRDIIQLKKSEAGDVFYPETHANAVVGLGAAGLKAVTDSTSASAIGTGTSVPTERDIYYGLPKINNAHNYTSSTSIYAPTSGGTEGQVLTSSGSTNTPT